MGKRTWSDYEMEWLKKNYPKLGISRTAKPLSRTCGGIRSMAKRLKLKVGSDVRKMLMIEGCRIRDCRGRIITDGFRKSKPWKCKPLSNETKRKISEKAKIRFASGVEREKARLSAIKQWQSPDKREKMTHRNHHSWNGGETYWQLVFRGSPEYRKFRSEVKKRDIVCRICKNDDQLEVHHVEGVAENRDKALDMNNAILLCGECHSSITELHRQNTGGLYEQGIN